MDLLDPFKIGIIVLFFVPGFIFIQVTERHLLREKKPQFEKTFEIILWSAFLWVLSISVHNLVFGLERQTLVMELILEPPKGVTQIQTEEVLSRGTTIAGKSVQEKRSVVEQLAYAEHLTAARVSRISNGFAIFYFVVCLFALISGTLWGIFRKQRVIDSLGIFVSGRDWYPSVKFKFFAENINRAVEFKIAGDQYLGTLLSAPDTKEDDHLIIQAPKKLVEMKTDSGKAVRKYVDMPLVRDMLINIGDVSEFKSYSDEILVQSKNR